MEFDPSHRIPPQCRAKCSAMGCNSKMHIDTNLSFHRWPKKGSIVELINSSGRREILDKRSQWMKRLGVKSFHKSAVVCSKHFSRNDYLPDVENKKIRFLRVNAVPKFVSKANIIKGKKERAFKKLRKEEYEISRQKSFERRTLLEKDNSERMEENLNSNESNSLELKNHVDDCEARINKEICGKENKELSPEHIEKLRVKFRNYKTLSAFIDTEADLKIMCNIMSLEVLNKLVSLLDAIFPSKEKKLLSTRDCIIITAVKLKLDLPFNVFPIFYKSVSEGSIRNIFYVTIKKLGAILQTVIKKVPTEEIESNIPNVSNEFSEITSIGNCTEVKIKNPKCSKCREKFHSYYNGQLSIKFMTEVTPAGLIKYVGKSFIGGRSNDTVFTLSEISQHLESEKEFVMENKEFSVADNVYIQNKIKLQLVKLLSKKEVSAETMTNTNITRARLYIEIMRQQMKEFKILNNQMPWYMINYIEDIFIVSCGLANLESPISADDDL